MESAERERALWAEHYGPLAGWLLATTGDRSVAYRLADDAFVRLFSHLPASPDCARRRLYRGALTSLEHWLLDQRSVTGVAGGWLARLVDGLPPRTRSCVLLEHAGLADGDIARMLHLHTGRAVRRLLALAGEGAQPTAEVIRLPAPRAPEAVSPRRDDERVGSAS